MTNGRTRSNEIVRNLIDDLLATGVAETRWHAEEMFLDEHLNDLVDLLGTLLEDEVADCEGIKLLMSHGSGGDQSPACRAGYCSAIQDGQPTPPVANATA